MKALLALIIKAVIFLLVFYFGIIALMELPRQLYSQAQQSYHAIFESPQNQARNFDQWAQQVRNAIATDRQQDVIKNYSVYLLFPTMRQHFKAYHQSFIPVRQHYIRLVDTLEQRFANNHTLKQSWEMAILNNRQTDGQQWSQQLYRFFEDPRQSSETLANYLKFQTQKQNLLKRLKQLEKQIEDQNTVVQTHIKTQNRRSS